MPKVKWAQVPFRDRQDGADGEDEIHEDSESSSTLLGEKPKPQSKTRSRADQFLWLVHIALLGANITWWLSWNMWAHPADSHSM